MISLVIVAYSAYQLYEAAVQNAERRVRSAAAKGIGEGIGSEIGRGIRRSFN
jgi:hypothetical protein